MTPGQLTLAYSRDTDPESSRDGARRARVNGQRATILRTLWQWEQAFGPECVSLDADQLHSNYDYTQRSVWSSRLAAMERAGWLRCDREQNPIRFSLSPAGRRAARELTQ